MRSILGACLLTASFAAHAWADGGPKKGSDADDAFMTGIRKLGVMSGEAFECSDVVDQPKIGQAVIDLATQVSLHFGLQAAFVYSGSFGYGMGHDFDHKTCPQALEDFKALQAKYLEVASGCCGAWMEDLVTRCCGHHQPQEEVLVLFAELLRHLRPDATMVETGWVLELQFHLVPLPASAPFRSFVIEPDPRTWMWGEPTPG
jgi:hypothetical protein